MARTARQHPFRMKGTIVAELRRRIEAGEFPPGGRLPTRKELEAEFQVAGVTMERAINQLVQDGFLYAKRRWGTFVAERPPHLCRYALAFGAEPSDGHRWLRFWAALANEAVAISRSKSREVEVFYGLDRHQDSEDFQKLRSQIQSRRLAGVIYAFVAEPVMRELVELQADLPWVTTMLTGVSATPSIVGLDGKSFVDKALDCLQEKGRRRIAILAVAGQSEEMLRYMKQGLAVRGMSSLPYWTQFVHPAVPEVLHNLMGLLMRPEVPAEQRPDGLVIWDDNMVEHASAGLVSAGVRVPQDLEIAAHCNFPWPTASVLPVHRIGYDADEVMGTCFEILDENRRGESHPLLTEISAVTEGEWMTRNSRER